MSTDSTSRLFETSYPNLTRFRLPVRVSRWAETVWSGRTLICASLYLQVSDDGDTCECEELARYYRVDDRPSVAPEHEIRVVHVQVLPGCRLPLNAQIGALESGGYVVVMERVKRPHREDPDFLITSVAPLVNSRFVDAQKTLARLTPSLEGQLPSLGWLTSK